jgi:hypothetical protein
MSKYCNVYNIVTENVSRGRGTFPKVVKPILVILKQQNEIPTTYTYLAWKITGLILVLLRVVL